MIAALALSAAGCGSTVQQHGQQLSSGDVGVAAGSTTGAGSAAAATADATAAGGGGGAGGAVGAKPTAGTTASGGRGGTAAAPVARGSGFGYTATEVDIGYFTWKDVSKAGTAAGIAGANYGDQEATARALTNDINAHGGIAGRKVVPIFYDYQTADILGNPSAGDQKACTALTEDHPVFAVIAVTGPLTEVVPACLAQHHVPLLVNDNIDKPQKVFDKYKPYIYSTASPTTEHFVHAGIPRAAANGYFTGWDATVGGPGPAPVKVGLLSSEGEAADIFDSTVGAELAKIGLKVTTTIKLSGAGGLDESQLQSAVLQFRNAGVTHIIPYGLNLLLFPQSAESQHYRPRYFVSTVQALTLVQETAPKAQLVGAMGVGFFPTYDVDNAHDPGDVGPAEAHCRAIHQQNGQDTSARNAFNLMLKACDGFAFLQRAIAAGGLSPEGVYQAVRNNVAVDPSGTFGISYLGGRFDGPAAVRDLGYDSAKQAFVYLSNINHPM